MIKRPARRTAQYPIRAVSRLTGIGIDTLRAWERRYGAVKPTRDERGRMYTEHDVARLRLLHQAIASGHSIGRVAPLSDQELRRLAAAHAPAAPAAAHGLVEASAFGTALSRFDTAAIDREFSRLAATLTPIELVRGVLLPSLREVGDAWSRRRGGIAQEHLVSSTLRHLLGSFLRVYSRPDATVRLLFATPAGDRHEIGILAAAMLAASQGLAVSYLGPDLPAGDIVAAVKEAGAMVLVLGLTFTDDPQATQRELQAVVRALPRGIEIWAGGPGANQNRAALKPRGLTLADFDAYVRQLARLADTQRTSER